MPFTDPAGAVLGASVASIPVFGRSLPDLIYSAVTGQDCSIVRLEQGRSYCRAEEALPVAPQVCTPSLGVPDCWVDPTPLNGSVRALADGPARLTAEQEANRTRRWPAF